MRDRAYRRAQRKRFNDKTYRILKSWDWMNESESELKSRAVKMAKHRHVCSCQMCRNPRRSLFYNNIEKLTMQERRQLDEYNTQKEGML